MSRASVPAAFPVGGRRGVVYSVPARRGRIAEAAVYAIERLRQESDEIILVTGPLDDATRKRMETLVDDVVEDTGAVSGLWGARRGLACWGRRVEDFDEIVVTGDRWFGPVGELGPTFERMDRRALDVWSITDRRHPRRFDRSEGRDGAVELSSYWLAVRRRALQSSVWRTFWDTLPAMPDAPHDARRVESELSHRLMRSGFRGGAAFPSDDYPAEHPEMFNAELLIADGCPAVVREVFDGYPLFFDQHAIVGRRIAAAMGDHGYPLDLLWQDLVRTMPPKSLHTQAAMMEVLPESGSDAGPPELAVVGVVQVVETDDLHEVFSRLASVPGLRRVVCSSPDETLAPAIDEAWRTHGADGVVLTVVSAPGRLFDDVSIVFDLCHDDVFGGGADVVIALHTGSRAEHTMNARRYLRKQQLDCLLAGPDYVRNLLDLFRREPGLGMVFPPTPHIGVSNLGSGWLGLRDRARDQLREMGVDVPLDWASPHAPLGGMWIGRPEALSGLAGRAWAAGREGSDLHRRLLTYVAAEAGYHTRTVATAEHAGLSHGSLEYVADHMAMTSYGYPAGYTSMLHRAGDVGSGQGRDFARMYLRYRAPRALALTRLAAWVLRPARPIVRVIRQRMRRNP
ncbi:rhamnan synthesis F family protein [Microbacterium plantarum]|uniref:rhamnan synthesis F family protein n=1 Tax=Microbacterium plantarum TaxID=1816425 RepID=UPI002B45DA1A|nr:rhamnan synthesis F family protein [Microbacterium plantarum]WRK16657.1 rhamnan synthesis F family protein [Microbacterium plantarum]